MHRSNKALFSRYRYKLLAGFNVLILIVAQLGALISPTIASAYSGAGTGTIEDPYLITSCAEFKEIDDELSASYALSNDLNCTSDGNTIMVARGGDFSGDFDGNNHTITIDLSDTEGGELALFGTIMNGSIHDLGVSGTVSIVGSYSNAALVAVSFIESTATQVSSSGTVTAPDTNTVGGLFAHSGCESVIQSSSSTATVIGGENVGGLVGADGCEGPGSSYSDSYATGDVTGASYVGGLVGRADYADFEDVYAAGDVDGQMNVGGLIGYFEAENDTRYMVFHAHATGDVSGSGNSVGGLVGNMDDAVVSQSYATGDVSGSSDASDLGGLIGYTSDSKIVNSYSRGNVTLDSSSNNVGGLIGYAYENRIVHSYATGTPTGGENRGGLVGYNEYSDFISVFWDEELTSVSDACGLNFEESECEAIDETTANMKTEETFTDVLWNFDTVWGIAIETNDGYPHLLGGAHEFPDLSTEPGPVETILDENQFHGGGVAQEWNCDDCQWDYELPFTFTFYGEDYSTVWVSSNGYISFTEAGDYDFDLVDGIGSPLISAISGDLDTECGSEGDDIYITDEGDGTVIFRWQAVDHRECGTSLNFEIVLHSDSTFELNYGEWSADVDAIASVGVHDGENSYVLSDYNYMTNLSEYNTSAWQWIETDDDDGVDQETENEGPNGGDANDDGTPDGEQAKVTSIKSLVNDNYVVVEATDCSANTGVAVESESEVETEDDDSYSYPVGLVSFTLTGCTVGSTETITQYYYGDYTGAIVVRKYNSTTHEYTTIGDAVISTVTIGGQNAIKVVYQVTDGGALDEDGTANGEIVDPAGIAVLAATTTPAAAPATGLESHSPQMAYVAAISGASLLMAMKRRANKR